MYSFRILIESQAAHSYLWAVVINSTKFVVFGFVEIKFSIVWSSNFLLNETLEVLELLPAGDLYTLHLFVDG